MIRCSVLPSPQFFLHPLVIVRGLGSTGVHMWMKTYCCVCACEQVPLSQGHGVAMLQMCVCVYVCDCVCSNLHRLKKAAC